MTQTQRDRAKAKIIAIADYDRLLRTQLENLALAVRVRPHSEEFMQKAIDDCYVNITMTVKMKQDYIKLWEEMGK